MQRLGFLKYVVYKCSHQDSIGINDLGKDLISKVTKKYSVNLTQEIKEYIIKRLTDKVYRSLRNSVKDIDIKKNPNQKILIELQDILLSAKEIPSKTGKLISDDWKRYPYLASSLGLVRKGSYSLLVRGKVFLEFVDWLEIDTFITGYKTLNPLNLSDKQKLLLLYSFLENDGYILKQLYANLIKINEPFSDRQAGDYLPYIYREVCQFYNSRARTGEEKDKLHRLLKSAETIEKWKGRSYSGKGAREESITVRVEPFVDLGLLNKSDPYRYEYSFSMEGNLFFLSLSESENVEKFLDHSFFNSLNQAYQLEGNAASDNEILEALYWAYDRMKSPLGYAPIKEIALLSAIETLVDKNKYFEISQATSLISKYQKENPYALRFQVDRSGAPVYVKFLQAIDV